MTQQFHPEHVEFIAPALGDYAAGDCVGEAVEIPPFLTLGAVQVDICWAPLGARWRLHLFTSKPVVEDNRPCTMGFVQFAESYLGYIDLPMFRSARATTVPNLNIGFVEELWLVVETLDNEVEQRPGMRVSIDLWGRP